MVVRNDGRGVNTVTAGGAVILAVIDNYCRQYFRRAKRAEEFLYGFYYILLKKTPKIRCAKRAGNFLRGFTIFY